MFRIRITTIKIMNYKFRRRDITCEIVLFEQPEQSGLEDKSLIVV